MNDKAYIIWLDILGFEKLAEEVAEKHGVTSGKVREDFVNLINNRLESLEGKGIIEKRAYRKEYDAFVLFVRGLNNVFRCIRVISNVRSPYKSIKKVPVEIAVGLFRNKIEFIESYDAYENEAIKFLKSYIIDDYRQHYKHEYGYSPKEGYILITEDVYNDLGENEKRQCAYFKGSKINFFKFSLANEVTTGSLDITKLIKECLYEDYKLLKIYRPPLEDEEYDFRYNHIIKKEIYSVLEKKKGLLSQITQIAQLDLQELDIVCYVEFSDNISSVTFKCGDNILKLDNPLLLWECSCKVPDKYKNVNYNCRIHSSPHGETIGEAFGKQFTMIKYQDVKVVWFNTAPDILWPPAIESIFMAKVLKDRGYEGRIINNVLDIGCGTGFLGIFLAKLNKHVKTVYFSDILLTPLLITKLNWKLNFNGDKISKVFLSDAYENFPHDEVPSTGFDLVICNPPFLPTLGFERLLYSEAATSGTRLLEKVIIETKKYGNELIIGCSSMSFPEFDKAIEKAKPNKIEVLGERDVPFRILHAFKHEEFMRKLIDEKRIEVKNDTPFKCWSKFYVYRLTY